MPGKNLLIFAPVEGAYSETFIKNQIKYLDFEKVVIYGTRYEEFRIGNEYIVPKVWYLSLLMKVVGKLGINKRRIYVFLLKRKIRYLKINVALAQYGSLGAEVVDPLFDLHIPLVVHFHGADASFKPTLEELKFSYINMFSKCKSIIAVSSSMVTRLINIGAPKDKIFYNCYGVDINKFKFRETQTSDYILSVGRFVEKKAPHLTILAFFIALERNKELKLKMIGNGALLNSCKQLARALNIEKAVEFLGVQSPEYIAELMSNAICYVQHSVIAETGDAEGTPLAILEAGASGIPVVSTRHEGIADVIQDGVNGFLVDEFDVQGMAAKIDLLVNNKGLASSLGINARSIISNNFNLNRHITALSEILNLASLS
jgi:colanic acid/amylovoran biosynthesis glycosyltransferase